METESEFTIQNGESVADAGKRLGLRPGETWDQLRARRLTEDAAFRQDARDSDAHLLKLADEREAEQRETTPSTVTAARGAMLQRMGIETAHEDGPSAESARKGMEQRLKDSWKKKKGTSPTDTPARPPESASMAAEEESEGAASGDDDEEGDEEEIDSASAQQAAHSARVRDAWKTKRAGK